MRITLVCLVAGALMLVLPARAQVRTYDIAVHPDTEVTYTAVTTRKTVIGKSGGVHGVIAVDPLAIMGKGTRAHFEVAMSTLSSGISYRDEVLRREKWLDSRRHPFAVFELTRIKSAEGQGKTKAQLKPGQVVVVKAEGTLSIKGQRQKVELSITVTAHEPNETQKKLGIHKDYLVLRTRFDVDLAFFGIGRNPPAAWAHTMPKAIRVGVNLVAVSR